MPWTPGPGPTSGNDVFVGTAGADTANGLGGSDHLSGAAGDDELTDTTGGNDILLGEDGNDFLFVERSVFSTVASSTVVLNGGAGDDRLTVYGGQSNRPISATLIGGDGADQLNISFAYASGTVDAGDGDDRVVLSGAGAVTVTLGTGTDVLQISGELGSYVVTDFVTGNAGDQLDMLDWLEDRLQNWDGANPFGAGGYVRLLQDGADTLFQVDLTGGGDNFVTLLRLQNTNSASFTAYNVVFNPDGSPSAGMYVVGDADANTLVGFDGEDHLEGLRGDDSLFGGAGDDLLEGGSGWDRLDGGAGDDLIYGGEGGDLIFAGANTAAYGGNGDDTFYAGGGAAGHTQLFGEAGNDLFFLEPVSATQLITADGGEGADQFTISSGASGGGVATANGGLGDDHFDLVSIQSAVTLVLGDGRDHIGLSGASTIGAAAIVVDFGAGPGGDHIDIIPYLQAVLPTWDQQSNPFAAGLVRFTDVGGSAVLQVRIGGAWRDTLVLQNVSSAFVLAENVSGLSPLGAPLATVTIQGGYGGDEIFGWIGPDVIYGGDGDDELRGGNGADQLFGGAGRDSLWGDAGNDILDAGGGSNDEIRGGAGSDTYIYERGYGQLLIYGFEAGADSIIVRGYSGYTSITQSGQDVLIQFGDSPVETITLPFFNLANFNANSITFVPARTVPPMPAIMPPTGTQMVATLLDSDLTIAAGSSFYTNDFAIFVHQSDDNIVLTNSGSLTGFRSGVAGAGLTSVLYSDRPFTLHNTSTGVLRAVAEGEQAGAIGFNSVNWAFTIINDGLIEVVSLDGRAAAGAATWFTNNATGVVRVWAGERGIGIGQMLGGGELFYNAGLIEVIGHDSAVAIGGAREWTNTGTIRVMAVDRSIAVGMTGSGTFINSGLVEGDYSFRYSDESFSDIFASSQRIENSGQIHGHIFLSAGDDTVINTNEIVGDIDLSLHDDRVENDGVIDGSIDLGPGLDIYTGGGEVSGSIFAGEGADHITGGENAEIVFGGEGDDVINGGGGDDYIDTGRGTDSADGGDGFDTLSFVTANMRAVVDLLAGVADSSGQDSVAGFERVIGSRYDDEISGADGAETLEGAGGDDVLQGRGGTDILDGGTGDDLMAGGTGADQFRFVVGGGDDTIADFSAADGDQIAVYGFANYESLQQVGANVVITFAPYNSIRVLNADAAAVAAALTMSASVLSEETPGTPPDISENEIVLWTEDYYVRPGEEVNLGGVHIGVHLPTIPHFFDSYVFINEGSYSVSGHSGVFGAFVDVENRAGAVFRVTLASPGDGELAIGISQHDLLNHGLFEVISSEAAWGVTSTQSVENHGVLRIVAHGGVAVREVATFINTGLVETIGAYVFSGGGLLIDNSGTLRSLATSMGQDPVAIRLDYYAGGVHTINNSGLIEAGVAIQATTETLHLNNDGHIIGRMELASGDDRIINVGLIEGGISLGGGADFFDGTLGIQSSLVWAGDGDDQLLGGDQSDYFNGASGDDILFGGGGPDVLIGEAGGDLLDGGAGADQMTGEAGNDTYYVDNVGDVVTELTDEGTDTIHSSINYTLGANVENLTLAGSTNLNGTGNTLGNVITGSAGDNALDGGAGADSMSGGAGNDQYVVDNVGDVVTELSGEGTDTVYTSVTYTLSADVEQISALGAVAINLFGNGLANLLVGNSAVNGLDGGAGADTLIGGGGNDLYFVDNIADVIIEGAGEGDADVVYTSLAFYQLGDNVEQLSVTAATGTFATGNSLNNLIVGNAGADALDGGAGIDTLVGGAGNDSYFVDDVADLIIEGASEGAADVVYTGLAFFQLGDNVEQLSINTGAGTYAVGNNLSNLIVGNSGADALDGGAGVDILIGGAGNDSYFVDNIADVIIEGAGEGDADVVYTSLAFYQLGDNVEQLSVTASTGTYAVGNSVANLIVGNSGADALEGRGGGDVLVGGDGPDTFVYNNASEGGDAITDFVSGVDHLRFSAAGFGGGLINGGATPFVSGSDPTSVGASFLYDTDDGRLYWDSDGAGGAAAILIATLSGAPTLTQADIIIGP